ncbi:MAG: 50S ribosomal protein P1 [Candidatus Baldrarchaeia archaeon]
MEYVYATLLLHRAGKEINEENLRKVLEAAGISADAARIKAFVAAIGEINIEEAIKSASFVAPIASTAPSAPAEEEKAPAKAEEEKKEKEEKKEEEEITGLGALFG